MSKIINPSNQKRRKVLIYGIDGLDGREVEKLIKKNLLPNLTDFLRNGSGSLLARDHQVSLKKYQSKKHRKCCREFCQYNYSLASSIGWSSVLTGTSPSNLYQFEDKSYMDQPYLQRNFEIKSFLKMAYQKGLSVSAIGSNGVISKENLTDKDISSVDSENIEYRGKYRIGLNSKTGNCTHRFHYDSLGFLGNKLPNNDPLIITKTIEMIDREDSDLNFMVLNDLKIIGHRYGFYKNIEYRQQIDNIDFGLGIVIEHLEKKAKKDNEEWLLIFVSVDGNYKSPNFGWSLRNLFSKKKVPVLINIISDHLIENNLTNFNNLDKNYLLKIPDWYSFSNMIVFNLVSHWLGLEISVNHPIEDQLVVINRFPKGKFQRKTTIV